MRANLYLILSALILSQTGCGQPFSMDDWKAEACPLIGSFSYIDGRIKLDGTPSFVSIGFGEEEPDFEPIGTQPISNDNQAQPQMSQLFVGLYYKDHSLYFSLGEDHPDFADYMKKDEWEPNPEAKMDIHIFAYESLDAEPVLLTSIPEQTIHWTKVLARQGCAQESFAGRVDTGFSVIE